MKTIYFNTDTATNKIRNLIDFFTWLKIKILFI